MPPTEEAVWDAVQTLIAPDADTASYLDFHRRRYGYLMQYVGRVLAGQVPRDGERLRLLDVGMSHQTALLGRLFPDVELATLGFYDRRFPQKDGVAHTQFNLNLALDESAWPRLDSFDMIVLAEVIEHLYVPPTRLLRMLRSFLRPGGILMIQTPNPVNLARRLGMIAGRSPFEIIRDDVTNPGHYCEYTLEQLQYLAGVTEMEVVDYELSNYFGRKKTLYNLACSLLPGRLAEGITILFRRPYA
ncbi:MAG TPA: class I SAM-dependent methyltransferase [Bryobacteraceae bacterium]|nr:class I SAM-dependent methyltransferase [Bryobacteraceae bacterium]